MVIFEIKYHALGALVYKKKMTLPNILSKLEILKFFSPCYLFSILRLQFIVVNMYFLFMDFGTDLTTSFKDIEIVYFLSSFFID